MIEQLIFRGTAQGFRRVDIAGSASFAGGEADELRLAAVCRVPEGAIGRAPVFTRVEFGGLGAALSRTDAEPDGCDTFVYKIPGEDLPTVARGIVPADELARPWREGAMAASEWASDGRQAEFKCFRALFGDDHATLARLLEVMERWAMTGAVRGPSGVCVLVDAGARETSLNAYAAMETLLRVYPKLWYSGIGYRSLWTAPQDVESCLVFFASTDCPSEPRALEEADFALIDLASGRCRMPDGGDIRPSVGNVQFARALIAGDSRAVQNAAAMVRGEQAARVAEAHQRVREAAERAEGAPFEETVPLAEPVPSAEPAMLWEPDLPDECAVPDEAIEETPMESPEHTQAAEPAHGAAEAAGPAAAMGESDEAAEPDIAVELDEVVESDDTAKPDEAAGDSDDVIAEVPDVAESPDVVEASAAEAKPPFRMEDVFPMSAEAEPAFEPSIVARMAEPVKSAEAHTSAEAGEVSDGAEASLPMRPRRPIVPVPYFAPRPRHERPEGAPQGDDPVARAQRFSKVLFSQVFEYDGMANAEEMVDQCCRFLKPRDRSYRLDFLNTFLNSVAGTILPMIELKKRVPECEFILTSAALVANNSWDALFHWTTLDGSSAAQGEPARGCVALLKKLSEADVEDDELAQDLAEWEIACAVFEGEASRQKRLLDRLECMEAMDRRRRMSFRRDLSILAVDCARHIAEADDPLARASLTAFFYANVRFSDFNLSFNWDELEALLDQVRSRNVARQYRSQLARTVKLASDAWKHG